MKVRPATVDDAEAIALVHVVAWREAYAHLLPTTVLDALDVQARADRWRTFIAQGESAVWVDADAPAKGWASAGPARDSAAPRPLELTGLYVLASAYGSGLGQTLLDEAIGTAPAYLWVAAENPRAIAFYRRNGFEPDGGQTVKSLEGHAVSTVRLVR